MNATPTIAEHPAVALVREFLDASMAPDPERAARCMGEGARIVFTGGREMPDVAAVTAFNAARYRRVKKALGAFDCVERDGRAIVYATGTLHGEWPDGRAFAGNRYVDRYEVVDGRIVRMDVWNDSAERLLDPSLDGAGPDAVA